MKMNEYNCVIKIEWGCNNHEAKSKDDYIEKVKNQYHEQYGISLDPTEITQIKMKK
tara:strand:- start:324 stop:491 length:168 start_codon:yes stop_codon:yes gene_type:complete